MWKSHFQQYETFKRVCLLCLCLPAGWVHSWPWQKYWRPGVHHWMRMKSGVCFLPQLRPYWTFPKKVTTQFSFPPFSFVWVQASFSGSIQEHKKTLILKRCALPGALCSGSGNMCSVLSPGSVLLSANGSLAFKSCARHEDVASFTAPEVQQGHNASTRTAAEKVGKTQTLPWHLWKKNATHGPGQAC